METSTVLAIASLLLTIISMVWVGGFRMSAVIHKIKDVKEDIREIKSDMREMRNDFHKMDLRVNALEQRKSRRKH